MNTSYEKDPTLPRDKSKIKKKASDVKEKTLAKTTTISSGEKEFEESMNYPMKVNSLKINSANIIIRPHSKEEVEEKKTSSNQVGGTEKSQVLYRDNGTVMANKKIDNNANDSDMSADIKVIPVAEENFNLTKKTVLHEMKISKRRATKTEKIEVPIIYEEVYVGDQKLGLYGKEKEEDGRLSKIKHKITDGFSASSENDIEYRYPAKSSPYQASMRRSPDAHSNDEYDKSQKGDGELVALIEGGQEDSNNHIGETEKTISIWGEEIIVSKRKIKLGELVIRKRRTVENRKINVELKKERVTVVYPNGSQKELTSSPSP